MPTLGAQALRELAKHADAADQPRPTSPHSEALDDTLTIRTARTEGTDR
jgi:hypothetical protein